MSCDTSGAVVSPAIINACPRRTCCPPAISYLSVSGATGTQPLVTPNSGLVSKDRHVIVRSSETTVVGRGSGKVLYGLGGTQPLMTMKAPLARCQAGLEAADEGAGEADEDAGPVVGQAAE